MGNIRPSFIKIRAIRLLELYPDQFTDSFDDNKRLVSEYSDCLLYTSPSPRDRTRSRMPSSA